MYCCNHNYDYLILTKIQIPSTECAIDHQKTKQKNINFIVVNQKLKIKNGSHFGRDLNKGLRWLRIGRASIDGKFHF